ncbi:MAG: alpha/beta hydrolase [Chloroflexaceae bacterium]|jgi:pimeloyl-ACP methyl ester carboxylesterase|nr:alpha/beta hydrolase [Chloroflexaceae bacterium]
MQRHLFFSLTLLFLLTGCGLLPLAQQPTATPLPPITFPTPPPAAGTAPPPASGGNQTAATPGAGTAGYQPRFEDADCRFSPPAGREARCGYLVVPEDRANPAGRSIRLHVAIFKSDTANPAPDPLVYLDGGPGGNPLETISFSFNDWFGPFAEQRDVIVFDQRGTGYSEPALDCPELTSNGLEALSQNLSRREQAARDTTALLACRDRLQREGANLAAYNNNANAADVNDLRLALGYEQLNLFGISYGTRLALITMRDFPAGVRSAILDSAYPPQNDPASLPANADRAFRALFARCAADTACNQAYPNLEQTFYDTVARLEREPLRARVPNPFDGRRYEVLLNGRTVLNSLFNMLYETSNGPRIPRLINELANGRELEEWGYWSALWLFASDYLSYGMYYSVECQAEYAFIDPNEASQASARFPRQLDTFSTDTTVEQCQQWVQASKDPREEAPVQSSIPTLILAGEFDPVTPPEYGRSAATSLPNSHFFEFPAMGHAVSVADTCPQAMAVAFVNNPASAPDSSCIARMPPPDFQTER